MADTVGEIFVALRPDDSRLQPEMEAALTKALGPVVAKGAKILGGLFVGKQVVGVARAGIAELAEAGRQEGLLAAQITATGGAAGITLQHTQDLAAANLDLAATDDELTLAAERVLLQFSRISTNFDETLASSQDLAVTLGEELPAATRQLGLALQDPTKAARLLRSANIALTASQQEQIQAFMASGDILSAQRVILDQVKRSVGGAAAEYGQTLAGDLQRAQEELENTKASLLEGAVPAIKLFASASTAASQTIQDWPMGLRTLASGAIALAGFAPTLLNLRATLLQSAAAKSTLSAADATGVGSTAAHTAAIEANTAALLLNAPVVETNAAALGAMAVAEGEVAAGATVAATASRGFMATLALWAIPAAAALAIGEGLAQAFHLFGQSSEHLSVDLHGLIPTVDSYTTALRATQGSLVDLASEDFANQTLEQSVPAAKNLADALDATGHSSSELRGKIAAQELAERELTAASRGLTLAEFDLTTAQETRLAALSGLVTAERSAENAARGAASASRSLADARRDLARAEQDLALSNPAEDRAKAEISLREARIAQGAAAKTVGDEEARLAQLRSGSGASVEELAAQEKRLADAREAAEHAQRSLSELEREARINNRRGIAQTREQRLAIEDAARAASKARQAEADETSKLAALRTPASIASIAEQELKLEQARLAQRTAIFAVRDAETALQTVDRKGVDAADAVIDARQRVRDAQNQVSDAVLSQIDATAALAGANDILAGKTETAASKARNLRTAIQGLLDQVAPGTPGRRNLEDEIHLLDLLIGDSNTIAKGLVAGLGAGGLSGVNHLFGAATGFAGTISQPTLGLFGEGHGPEDVLAVPHSQGGIQLGSQVTISVGGVHFHGAVPTETEAFRTGQAVGAGISDVLVQRGVRLAKRIA